MDELETIAERVLTWLLLPATLLGTLGGGMCAIRGGVGWKKFLCKCLGGCVTAHLATPPIYEHLPPSWHSIAIFLVGFGGLELVNFVYDACVAVLEAHIRRRAG